MPYATLQQLTDRYGASMLVDLTDRADPPSGAINAAVAERGRVDAEATIDGYIAAKYALPLAEVPQLLTDLALKLWIWNLHVHTPTDKVKADYDQALRTLRDIASGSVRLPGAAGIQPAPTGGSGATFTDRPRDFSPETMKGLI